MRIDFLLYIEEAKRDARPPRSSIQLLPSLKSRFAASLSLNASFWLFESPISDLVHPRQDTKREAR